MKKFVALGILVSFFLIGLNHLWAQDITNKVGVGARFMWLSPRTDSYLGDKGDLEGKSMFGGTLTYGINKWLSIELAFDYSLRTNLKRVIGREISGVEKWVKVAKVRVYPLTLSAQLRYLAPPEYYTWMVPYLTFGFGRYFVDCDVSKEYKDYYSPWRVKVDMKSAWVGNIGWVFEIVFLKIIEKEKEEFFPVPSFIHEKLVKFLKTKGIEKLYAHQVEGLEKLKEGENTIPSPYPRKGEIDLDSWMVGVGIKFYFGLPHR